MKLKDCPELCQKCLRLRCYYVRIDGNSEYHCPSVPWTSILRSNVQETNTCIKFIKDEDKET